MRRLLAALTLCISLLCPVALPVTGPAKFRIGLEHVCVLRPIDGKRSREQERIRGTLEIQRKAKSPAGPGMRDEPF